MKIEKIDHVVIRVSDLESSVKKWHNLLGGEPFTTPRELKEFDVKSSVHNVGLELAAPLTPDGPVTKTIEKRGEGLAVVAIKVVSLDDVIEEMKKRGARQILRFDLGRIRVAQYHPADTGGIHFSFIEYHPRNAMIEEYLDLEYPRRADYEARPWKVEYIDRVGVLVADRKAAWKFFEDLFEAEFQDLGECRYTDIMTSVNPYGLEIYEPLTPNGIIARAVEKGRTGLAHLSLKVFDCKKLTADWQSLGVRLLTEPKHGRTIEATFHPADLNGVVIELAEYHTRHVTLVEGQRPVRTPEEFAAGVERQKLAVPGQ